MRAILLFSAMVFAAGNAAACPSGGAHAHRAHPAAVQSSGSVFMQPRPLPGSVFPMPSLTSPVRGPHGGALA